MTQFTRKINMSPGILDTGDIVDANDINELQEAIEQLSFNVMRYGAVGDGVTDDTAAIQAAIDAAAALAPRAGSVSMPPGDYLAHELDWTGYVPITGASVGSTRLIYSGDGGAGSYVLKAPSSSGAIPYSGLTHMQILGSTAAFAGTASVAETGLLVDDVGVDWGFYLRSLVFYRFLGDAVAMTGGLVNAHIDHIRFGYVLGYCINLDPGVGAESRPLSLSRFTWDNALSADQNSWVAANYADYYQGENTAGKGLMYAERSGANIHISDGRVELNEYLEVIDGERALLRDGAAAGAAGCTWTLRNVVGFGNDGYILASKSARVSYNFDGKTGISRLAPWKQIAGTVGDAHTSPPIASGSTMFRQGNHQQHSGVMMNGQQVEYRDAAPSTSTFNYYRAGDVWYRRTPTPGTNGVGQIAVSPTYYGRAATGNGTTAAVVAASDTTVDMSGDPANFYRFFPGSAIVISGAGAAGVNLETTVESWDPANFTFEVNDSPSTSVNPATISFQQPTWREFGDIVSYGTTAPVSGTYAKGEKRWNTNPTEAGSEGSKYVVIGWICTVAGSPGTWLEMRTLTGN